MKFQPLRLVALSGAALLSCSTSNSSTPAPSAPRLYASPYNESPTRAEPDDLLLLPGYGLAPGDTVVYQAVGDTTQTLSPPASLPSQSSASGGVADLVSAADAPYSLTIRLPALLSSGQSYALWVQSPSGAWSNPALINDARPLWFTPAYVYQTAALATLPRQLKVVGRNLQAAPGALTQVRLQGPATFTLNAATSASDAGTTAALQRYVAKVQLPASMPAGNYSIQLSRDGLGWVPLVGEDPTQPQTLTVLADPGTPPQFLVSDPKYGGCRPRTAGQPDQDATPCVLAAVRAAYEAAGGAVVFGAGTWPLLAGSGVTLPGDGIVVPPRVSLQGAGAGATVIERGSAYPAYAPTFSLQGSNTVQGIDFTDDTVYTPQSSGQPAIRVGVLWYFKNEYHLQGVPAKRTSNVVITQNTFDKPFVAIGNGGVPLDHIFITNNVFGGAYNTAIQLSTDQNYVGDPDAIQYPYQFADAVIDNNSFYPSSYVSGTAAGVIATQISTGQRVDFSDNAAEGNSTQYLYKPQTDPKGWRAAYFWSTGNSQEMTLVSHNTATCPGDKAGDGEGVVYDAGSEWGGFVGAQPANAPPPGGGAMPVVSASSDGATVTLQGALVSSFPTTRGNGPTTIPAAYYKGFWLQLVQGPGLGQWRKITSVATAAAGTVSFTVAPAFDVPPQAGSLAILGRAYWQNATVSNFVDQRQPLCTKANVERPSGGSISWFSSTADSAMEGNQQYDTSGILLNHYYQLPGLDAQPDAQTFMSAIQSSNEVRNNLIDGEYQWSSAKSSSGIQLFYGATHDTAAPPVLGYGIAVSGNTITHADTANSRYGVNQSYGALGLGPSGWTGPLDAAGVSAWKMADSTLLFHNSLSNIAYDAADGLDRLGIGLDRGAGTSASAPVAWRSVYYGNTCGNVSTLFSDNGNGTVHYCPAGIGESCECDGTQSTDLALSLGNGSQTGAVGAQLSYAVTVTNAGPASASGVAVTVELPPGIQLVSLGSSLGSCDPAIASCTLGNMGAPGAANNAATISVVATAVASGTWPVLFSTTHQDPDPNVANNGIEIDTTVTQ